MLLFVLLVALCAHAQEPTSITVLDQRVLPVERSATSPAYILGLTLAYLEGSGWAPETIGAAVREGARILGQCGVALQKAELLLLRAPQRFHDFSTPVSRELARSLPLAKPTLYFVSGTRQRPAFEAEAIGRGNSRSRPELADTVWVTRDARHLGIVLAHELAHVLMDSGEHSDAPGNLMHADTAPENTRLSEAQCARLRGTGSANGLLH